MTFLWPKMLLWLLIAPVLVGAYVWILRRKKKEALRYASVALVRAAIGPGQVFRRHRSGIAGVRGRTDTQRRARCASRPVAQAGHERREGGRARLLLVGCDHPDERRPEDDRSRSARRRQNGCRSRRARVHDRLRH